MIVVLKHGVSDEKKEQLITWLKALGLRIHISDGVFQTVLGLIGDTSNVDMDLVESLEIVDSVKRVTEPFKFCNRKFHPESMVVEVGDVKIGAGNFVMIAGPCSVESEEQIVTVAKAVKAAAGAFRVNPKFDTEKAILELGTGEALISFQDEKGAPEVVERATILPPQSLMGAIDGITRNKVINASPLCGKYDEIVDAESAAEVLQQMADTKLAEENARVEAEAAEKQQIAAQKAAEKAANEQAKLAEKERIAAQKAAEKAEAERIKAEERRRIAAEKEAKKAKEKSQKVKDRVLGNILGSAGSTIGRKITDKILKDIFK